jgi:hypothetical protein
MDYGNPTIKLIARICEYFQENRLPGLGRIRITKLLYLIECEHCAWAKDRLTDLDWIFFHYGPWSKSLSAILEDEFKTPEDIETERGTFRPIAWTPPSFEKPKLKFDVTTEGILQRVLEKFASLPTGKLLDYVYYETEPMVGVKKGEILKFDSISRPERFIDPTSLLDRATFSALQKRFQRQEFEEIKDEDILTDNNVMLLCNELDSPESEFLGEYDIIVDDTTASGLRERDES